ncbi:hypothetical protein [Corynebacterium ulceribovis]|uniref:hypothetical protein n=1 Tax=Corynebacterium ulceribovis TaxID=487732 RepID=UPI000372DEF6|nr:hypothetical protein [Corynebacterium ulceribovis]
MRRLKNFALAASACVLAGGALTACSPPGEQPSDQPGGDPTRGAITSDGAGGAGGADGAGGGAEGARGADDISDLTQSGGRYNLIANHLVEGTVELRHDGKGTAAVVAEKFNTALNDGNYELRAYAVASCAAITGATDDLAVLGELRVDGGNASVTPRTGDVDPVQVLTIAAVKPGSAEVAACGPWIKWVGENQPADEPADELTDQPTESETAGG